MKQIPIRKLDSTSLNYLIRIDRASGADAAGVFIRCPGKNVSPRLGQFFVLCLGLALAVIAVVSIGLFNFEQISPRTAGDIQSLLLALGCGLVIGRLLALRRPAYRSPLGHFLWVDGKHFWQVTPEVVKVRPLDEVRSASASHYVNHSAYSHSEVFLRLRSGSDALTVPSRAQAEQLVQYLSAPQSSPSVSPVPTETEGEVEATHGFAGRAFPWVVAACALVAGMWMLPHWNDALREDRLFTATLQAAPGDEEPFNRFLKVYPEGQRVEVVQAAYEENLTRHASASPTGELVRYERCLELFPRGHLAVQVKAGFEDHLLKSAKESKPGVEGHFRRYLEVFPQGRYRSDMLALYEENLHQATRSATPGERTSFQRYLEVFPKSARVEEVRSAFEDNLYQFVKNSAAVEDEPCHRYLNAFPRGRFAAEVRQLYEERQFNRASAEARNRDKLGLLRAYLRDKANQRLRPQAQQQIDARYDQAINEFKKQFSAEDNKNEKPIFEGFCALLEALKRAESPVVTVKFTATQTDAPTGAWTRTKEKADYDAALKEHPGLKDLENLNGSAILSRGELFHANYTARRESIQFDRLQAALRRWQDPELLILQRATDGAPPTLEIVYHVYPAGSLLEYQEFRGEGLDGQDKPRVTGLLRLYRVQWTLKIRPPGTDKVMEYKQTTRDIRAMRIQREMGDPDWTGYAVMLYPAFREMSDTLLRVLGGRSDAVPERMSFREAINN